MEVSRKGLNCRTIYRTVVEKGVHVDTHGVTVFSTVVEIEVEIDVHVSVVLGTAIWDKEEGALRFDDCIEMVLRSRNS